MPFSSFDHVLYRLLQYRSVAVSCSDVQVRQCASCLPHWTAEPPSRRVVALLPLTARLPRAKLILVDNEIHIGTEPRVLKAGLVGYANINPRGKGCIKGQLLTKGVGRLCLLNEYLMRL
jgi:hypothetical protein